MTQKRRTLAQQRYWKQIRAGKRPDPRSRENLERLRAGARKAADSRKGDSAWGREMQARNRVAVRLRFTKETLAYLESEAARMGLKLEILVEGMIQSLIYRGGTD